MRSLLTTFSAERGHTAVLCSVVC